MRHGIDRELWKGVVAGAVGGLVASCVMERFQSGLSAAAQRLHNGRRGASRDERVGEQESASEPATTTAAEAISENLLGRPLRDSAKPAAGSAVHYAFGSAMGALYGGLAALQPAVTIGGGLPFGTAVWLAADEVAVPAAGLSRPPSASPPSTHLYALASHLVYGFTLDAVRRGMRQML